MATAEGARSNSIVSFVNYGTSSATTIRGSTEDPTYVAANLLSPIRSKYWKSTTDGVSSITWDLGLSTTVDIDLIAIIDSNILSGQDMTLACGTVLAIPDAEWTVRSWATKNGVFCFVLGTPGTGSFTGTERFWSLTLPNQGAGAGVYHKIGAVWLGSKYDIAISSGLNFKQNDKSTFADSACGALYSSKIRPSYAFDFDMPQLSEATAYGIKHTVNYMEGAKYCLVDTFAFSSDNTKRAHGLFYGTLELDNQLSIAYPAQKSVDLSFSFVESGA